MNTQYITLSKSQKALADTIALAESICDGTQVTFGNLPASSDKTRLQDMASRFVSIVGKEEKLTVLAMAKMVQSGYDKLVKGTTRSASSIHEKELANLKASLLMGIPSDVLLAKQDARQNAALYRKNLLLTDKTLQSLITDSADNE